jgi:hypothetical protein
MTNRSHILSDIDFLGISDHDGAHPRRTVLHAQQRKIQIRVPGNDLHHEGLFQILLVISRNRIRLEIDDDIRIELSAFSAGNHMIVGQHESIGRQKRPGAGATGPTVLEAKNEHHGTRCVSVDLGGRQRLGFAGEAQEHGGEYAHNDGRGHPHFLQPEEILSIFDSHYSPHPIILKGSFEVRQGDSSPARETHQRASALCPALS